MQNQSDANNTKKAEERGDIDNCKFALISQNVRGLREKMKRNIIFEQMKEKADIIFLQETHSTPDQEERWKTESGCKTLFSHGSSNARGVMILFSKSLDMEIIESTTDEDGRYIIIKCIIQGTKFLIYNIYAPNNKTEHKIFLSNLKEKVCLDENNEFEYKIGAGDWNFTEVENDRTGGNYTVWKENVAILEEINEKNDMIDIWRARNPETKRYTWRQRKPQIQSRIDRIYISDTMQYNVFKTDIVPGLRSDHSAITLSIKSIPENKQAGAGYWKFNNSLIENKEFSVDLKRYIENDIEKESSVIESKQVKWEYIKYKIKTWSMKKSKEIAKKEEKMK